MNIVLRDSRVTVVVLDSELIRATYGLQEYLAQPTVTLRACYAVPRSRWSTSNGDADGANAPEASGSGSGPSGRSSWIVDKELEAVQEDSKSFEDAWEVRWPFRPTLGSGTGAEDSQGDDWDGREHILTHLYSLLNITIARNFSPLLLVPPPAPASMPLSHQALYTQLAFEQLNVPGLSILASPLAAVYALNAVTGLVINVGRLSTEVAVVVDSVVRWECSASIPLGTADCERHLEELLMGDMSLEEQLRKAAEQEGETWSDASRRRYIREVVDFVFRECTGEDIEIVPAGGGKPVLVAQSGEGEDESFDVAKKLVGEAPGAPQPASHKSKKQINAAAAAATKAAADAATKAATDAAAAIAADVIIISIPSLPGKEIALGAIRHRLAEPLWKGVTSGGESVVEGTGRAVESEGLSVGERVAVWEAVAIVGDMARFRSFGPAFVTYLAPLLLSSVDLPSDVQPAKARLLSVPDYFTNFKGCTNDLAPFLGASMVGKVAFTDAVGKHYITKVDYNARGPAAIYTVTKDSDA